MIWHFILMAILYMVAGAFHFLFPKAYCKIVPDYFKNKKFQVYVSGGLEIMFGVLLCIPQTKNLAIFGIIGMLLVFLTVHINVLKGKEYAMGIPKIILLLRLPLQFILMWWALNYL